MYQNMLLRFFPITAFLEMPSVGLDLSDRSVKYVELAHGGGEIILARYGERGIPPGVIESGVIKERAPLVKIFESLRIEEKLEYLTVSLPEEKAYTVELSIPQVSRRELRESIELQLEHHIPVPVSEIVFDYRIIHHSKDTDPYTVVVSALPRDVVESYLDVFTESSLKPLAFEVEAQALTRALITADEKNTVMIVDFGRIRSGLSIASGGVVRFTSTVPIGGDQLVRAIMPKFNFHEEQARQLKEKDGLSTFSKNKELFFTLTPIVSLLRDEIVKYYNYWDSHHEQPESKISKIVLCGGDANVPGLVEHLSKGLPIPLFLANPWVNVSNFSRSIPEIHYRHSLRFATAIGLALRKVTHSHSR